VRKHRRRFRRKVRESGDRLMQTTRFVRTVVFFVTLGLGGLLLGCSGEEAPKGPNPEQKEAGKKKAAEFKDSMRQQKEARSQNAKGR
jgi:hypothetical protein